jgi:hypothetical protein
MFGRVRVNAGESVVATSSINSLPLSRPVALARQRSLERRQKEAQRGGDGGALSEWTVGPSGFAAAGDALSDDDDGMPLPEAPVLSRLASLRTRQLARVGLSQYRDKLVQRGLNSLRDLRKFDDVTLREVGMNATQRYIFDLMAHADESAPLVSSGHGGGGDGGGVGGGGMARARAAGDGDVGDDDEDDDTCCSVCDCSGIPLRALPCCRSVTYCDDCLARALASPHGNGYRICPNGRCGSELPIDLLQDLFRDRCCACAESFASPLLDGGGGGAGGGSGGGDADDVVDVDCGFVHRAHRRCLHAHVVAAIQRRHYPIGCPAAELCKCNVTERGVRKLVLRGRGDGAGSGVGAADDARDDDDAEGHLARFYETAFEHARRMNGLQRPCPNSACGALVPIRAASPSTFGVQCGTCQQYWCPVSNALPPGYWQRCGFRRRRRRRRRRCCCCCCCCCFAAFLFFSSSQCGRVKRTVFARHDVQQ